MAQEKNLETKIKDFLKEKNIYHFKTKGGIYGTIGLPDLVICINGKFVGLELKSKIGKASLQQYKNGAKITKNKGIFAIINDYDKFLELYNDLIKNKKVIRHTLSFEELSNLYKDTKEKKISNYMKKLNDKEISKSTSKVKRKVTKRTKATDVVNVI
jgi:hypothetical protein